MSQTRLIQRPAVDGRPPRKAALGEWHTSNPGRLPVLKLMRNRWVCNVAG